MGLKPKQAVAQITLGKVFLLIGSPVEPVFINELPIVAGSFSDHIKPLFPWDGLTVFEPQCFGYVSHDNPF